VFYIDNLFSIANVFFIRALRGAPPDLRQRERGRERALLASAQDLDRSLVVGLDRLRMLVCGQHY
jgi:hypothetical protein